METIPAKGHTEQVIPGKAATCTEAGLTEGKKCTTCGAVIVAQQTIPAKGHTEQVIPGKAATCTEAGLTEGKKCTTCGAVIVAQQTIPAKGHTEQVLPGKAATCTEAGLTEGKVCSTCGAVIVAQQTIPAKGHTEQVIPGKAATCTEAGLTEGKVCTVCGAVIVAQQEIPATGHQYRVKKVAATEERGGYKKYTCTVCGDSYKTAYTDKLEGPYGNIVLDQDFDSMEHDYLQEEGVLTITAVYEQAEIGQQRRLRLTQELLDRMAEEGVSEIRFVVLDAQMTVPLTLFDSDDLALIWESMDATEKVYDLILQPQTSGCYVGVCIMDAEDRECDITSLLGGVAFTLQGQEMTVEAAQVYQISANEE